MMKRILFLASLLLGLALAFAPLEAPRVIAQTFSGQPSPGYVQIGQGAAQPKWLPLSNQIDVFLIIGDSQAVGAGTSAQSPQVPNGQVLAYCANGTIVNANDPVCSAVTSASNANTGSMWPALGIAYNRRIGFVATGVGGTTQATSADFGFGNWQSTAPSSLYQNSLAALNAALTAYTNAGYVPVFRGIIYILGNNDALQIDSALITSPNYITAYTLMAANYRAATIGGTTYPHLPIYVAQVGTHTSQPDYGYGQIRSAQQAITTSDPNSLLVNVDLASYNVRGLVNSGVHLTQTGYNLLGTQLGAALIPFQQANIPFQLFTANAEGAPIPIAGTVVQIVGKDGVVSTVLNDGFGVAGFPEYLARYSLGPATSPSGPTNGTVIGSFGVQSFGATTYGSSGQGSLLFQATQNHTDTAKGTQACIYTTANNAASPTCNLLIGQNGTITLNTPLTPANGGTGNTAGAAQWITSAINVNFAVAGDNAIVVPFPAGYTRLCVLQVAISGASGNISAAKFGLFTASSGGGTAAVTSGTAITVTTAADNTNNNAQAISAANAASGSYLPAAANTMYFNVGTTTTGTANVQLTYRPCP